jgi:hypothetical protein
MAIQMRKIALKLVLSILVYSVSVTTVRGLANAIAYLMAKGGSADLWRILHEHPLGRSICLGFLAGLIPLQSLLAASGFFRQDIPDFLKKLDLEGMKRYVVILASPAAVVALWQWVSDWLAMHSKHVTVFQESSTINLSRMFEGFFSENCRNVSDLRLDLWSDNFPMQCVVHVVQISIFLTAAAYSLAPWVRDHFPKYVAVGQPAETDCSTLAEGEVHTSVNGDDRTQ